LASSAAPRRISIYAWESLFPCRLDFIFDLEPEFAGSELFLLFRAACPLGCLQRVDFLRSLFDFQLYMGGRNAIPDKPLTGRIHINPAVTARFQVYDPAAAFAFLNNVFTGAVFEIASLLLHKDTIRARSDGLTNHLFHLKKKVEITNKKTYLCQG
jgi:hypothetical protein